jgi:hypothetical protein
MKRPDLPDSVAGRAAGVVPSAAFAQSSTTGTQSSSATNQKPAQNDAQNPEQIIKHAIAVYGGDAYLNVRTVVGRGLYTTFRDGVSQLPAAFVDYIVYPDRERTEFTGGGSRVIQANVCDQGWVFDGAVKAIKDQKPEQIEDFKFGVKTGIDYLLRGLWRKQGPNCGTSAVAKPVWQSGTRRSAWIIRTVSGSNTSSAQRMACRRRSSTCASAKPDTGVVDEYSEEDHLAKPITIDGITAAWVIDHFINTKQSSAVAYESIDYNKPVADTFTKPATIKGLK